MSLRNIGVVYRKELTEAARDRRTLISSILIPLFLFPVLTFGIGYAFVEVAGEAAREPSKIMILGGEDSPDVVQELRKARNLRVLPRSADEADRSDLYTAIQQQLGLKVESTKAQVDVLVIDKVEKPSEN